MFRLFVKLLGWTCLNLKQYELCFCKLHRHEFFSSFFALKQSEFRYLSFIPAGKMSFLYYYHYYYYSCICTRRRCCFDKLAFLPKWIPFLSLDEEFGRMETVLQQDGASSHIYIDRLNIIFVKNITKEG